MINVSFLPEKGLATLIHSMPTTVLLFVIVVAFIVLIKGADAMIDGVVQLALRTRISMIFISATILSLGTTMPEAFVSVTAAWMGNASMALANGVGSIICDTGLIFGTVCLLKPMKVDAFILNRTGWVQVAAATLLVVIALFSKLDAAPDVPMISRWVGLLFLFLLFLYMYAIYKWSQKHSSFAPRQKDAEQAFPLPKSTAYIFVGLAGVFLGARFIVPCAAEAAARMGVADDLVAATMVAFGTSLPELATGIAAVRKDVPEIVVGNVVGADVLNCLFVIGGAAIAAPLSISPNFYSFHFPAMLTILYLFRFFIFMVGSGYFKRWHGFALLAVYVFYLVMQFSHNL